MTDTKKELKNVITFYVEKQTIKYKDSYFNAYKTKMGKLNIDVKFLKDVAPPLRSREIVVYTDDMNLNTSGDYPVIWVKSYQTKR